MFGRFVGVRGDVAYSRNELALRTHRKATESKSEIPILIFDSSEIFSRSYLKFFLNFCAVCGR